MPTPNPTSRREYKGAAAATTLQNAISSTDISLLLVAANNWPTGAVGKFIITINRGQVDEEKILCDSQTGRTVAFLLANRGFDGTTAQGHAAGATVECTISAFDADEWNQHTNATTGVHGVAGAVVGTTDAQTLTSKTLTAPVIATIVNTGTLTLPVSTDTLVGRATTDTLTNKTINGGTHNVGTPATNTSAVAAPISVQAQSTTQTPLIVKGIASQAQTLFEAQNSAGTAQTWLDQFGGFHSLQPIAVGNGASAGGSLLGGSGVPSSGIGSNGDYYFRTDAPSTATTRIYVKSAGAWVATAA